MKILAIGDFHAKFPQKLRDLIKKEKPDLILSDGDYAGIDEFRPYFKKMFREHDEGNKIGLEEIIGSKKYNLLLKKDFAEGKIPIKLLDKFNVPVLSVFGNGDWYKWEFGDKKRDYAKLIRKLKNVVNINRGCGEIGGIKVCGFGGYVDNDAYFEKGFIKKHKHDKKSVENRKKRYNKEKNKFEKIIKFSPDILLLHYTPYGCLDKMKEKGYYLTGKNMGVSFFNNGIEKYKPALVVCGHMHENQGQCKIGPSIIVNPGAANEGKCAFIDFDEDKKKVLNVRFIK